MWGILFKLEEWRGNRPSSGFDPSVVRNRNSSCFQIVQKLRVFRLGFKESKLLRNSSTSLKVTVCLLNDSGVGVETLYSSPTSLEQRG